MAFGGRDETVVEAEAAVENRIVAFEHQTGEGMRAHIFGIEGIATAKPDGALILKIIGEAGVKPINGVPAVAEADVHLAAIERKIVTGVRGEQVFQIEAKIGKGVVVRCFYGRVEGDFRKDGKLLRQLPDKGGFRRGLHAVPVRTRNLTVAVLDAEIAGIAGHEQQLTVQFRIIAGRIRVAQLAVGRQEYFGFENVALFLRKSVWRSGPKQGCGTKQSAVYQVTGKGCFLSPAKSPKRREILHGYRASSAASSRICEWIFSNMPKLTRLATTKIPSLRLGDRTA